MLLIAFQLREELAGKAERATKVGEEAFHLEDKPTPSPKNELYAMSSKSKMEV